MHMGSVNSLWVSAFALAHYGSYWPHIYRIMSVTHHVTNIVRQHFIYHRRPVVMPSSRYLWYYFQNLLKQHNILQNTNDMMVSYIWTGFIIDEEDKSSERAYRLGVELLQMEKNTIKIKDFLNKTNIADSYSFTKSSK